MCVRGVDSRRKTYYNTFECSGAKRLPLVDHKLFPGIVYLRTHENTLYMKLVKINIVGLGFGTALFKLYPYIVLPLFRTIVLQSKGQKQGQKLSELQMFLESRYHIPTYILCTYIPITRCILT